MSRLTEKVFVSCPTCGGEGHEEPKWRDAPVDYWGPCPDCVDGKIEGVVVDTDSRAGFWLADHLNEFPPKTYLVIPVSDGGEDRP